MAHKYGKWISMEEEVVVKVKKVYTDEERLAIRKIWEQYKGQYKLTYIFFNYLRDYFIIPEDISNFRQKGNPEFVRFMTMTRDWIKEEKRYVRKATAANLSEEEIEKIHENNTKEFVLLLQDTLDRYRKSPDDFRQLSFGDITKLYQIIEKVNGDRERLEIQRNKLKLDAVKMFLPYQRLSLGDLLRKKDLILESLDRQIKIREDEQSHKLPSGPSGEGAAL